MKKVLVLFSVVFLLSAVGSTATKTWTVDDNRAECPDADFTHPQDAVNAASPGDTIKIYPGTYYPLTETAPNVVVDKDGISIVAADPDPAQTVLIGGYQTAISIIASDVTISGLKFIVPFDTTTVRGWNMAEALVVIGALSKASPTPHLGSNNNTVSKCVFGDSGPYPLDSNCTYGENCGMAIQICCSNDNMLLNNTIYCCPLPGYAGLPYVGIDNYVWDPVYSAYSSKNNKIVNNEVFTGGIGIGLLGGPGNQSDHSGTKIHGNKVGAISFYNSYGRMIASGNVAGCPIPEFMFWVNNSTDYVIPGNANHGWPPGWIENGIIR